MECGKIAKLSVKDSTFIIGGGGVSTTFRKLETIEHLRVKQYSMNRLAVYSY